jgi:hypothetical protein
VVIEASPRERRSLFLFYVVSELKQLVYYKDPEEIENVLNNVEGVSE